MNRDRFLTIARHELRTQLRSPLPWALLLLVVLFTMSLNTAPMISRGGANPGDARLFNNTPYTLAFVFGLLGFMIYGFFSSIIAGMTVIRDDEARVSELLHSTPLTALEYAMGKLGGVIATLGLVLALHILFAIGHFQFGPLDSDLARGPFRFATYVIPALLFAAPVIWLFAGLAFAVGAWTRRPMVVFAVPTALFMIILTLGLQSLLSSPEPEVDRWLMILEPSGLRWLFRTLFIVDRGVEFYNTAPLLPDASLLLNRCIVLVLPAAAVALSVRRCAMTNPRGARAAKLAQAPPSPQPEESFEAAPVAELKMKSSAPGFLSSVLQLARAELREAVGQPGLYLFAALILGVVADGMTSSRGPFGAPPILTAGTLAVGSLGALTLLLCLVLMFQTVEGFQRDRSTGFDAILFAAPFRTGALILARNLAGAVIVALILLAATFLALTHLWLQEQGHVELWPIVLVWGIVLPPTCFLWNAFVTLVMAASRSRYLTYAVGLGALLATFLNLRRDWMSWVWNWTLAGTLRWSDMGTFALNGRPLILNRLLVSATAICLLAVAIRRFARVEADPQKARSRLRPGKLGRGALRMVPFATPPIVLAGLLGYQVLTGFQGGLASERAKVYRGANLATWSDFRPAGVAHVDLEVDLQPAGRSMTVRGEYAMVNRQVDPIRALPFTMGPGAENVTWSLEGAPTKHEDRSGLHVLQAPAPLLPGETLRVGFAYRTVHPRGSTRNGGGIPQFILSSGVALHTLRDSFLPVPGFVSTIGADPDDRDRTERAGEQVRPDDTLPFTTRISITAPSEYTVNSVGERTSFVTDGATSTVVWQADYPVGAINIVAGRWDVRRQGSNAVFYHPGHDDNVDEILATLVAARERYSEWFGPYPWNELRLSEFPDLVTNAQGFPTNIPFSEGIGFLTRSEAETRLPFLVTAHEVAHQWWGNVVRAAEGPGTVHLVEGLAHYSALLLYESELGLRGRIEFARSMEANYVRRRKADSELPLSRMIDDDRPADWTVVYEKGAWVQWMLQQHLGREQAFSGIREFVRGSAELQSRPVLSDLIDALRPVGEDAEDYQAFVDQWFHRVVLPEYRIAEAAVARSGDSWQVTATIENVGTGVNDVQIAASRGRRFADGDDAGRRYVDARTTLRLSPGVPERVSLLVDFEPQRLVVDPDLLVLQLNRGQAEARLTPGP